MKAKDFHKIIRETNVCDNKAMAESLKANNPDVFIAPERIRDRKARIIKRRIAIFVPMSVVCLACIIIPCVLLTRKPSGSNTGKGDKELYYCYSGEYSVFYSEKSLKELSLETDSPMLYFDWYDIGSDCVTNIHKLNNTDTIVCISESIYNLVTDDYIEIYVCSPPYVPDFLINVINACKEEVLIDNYVVKYSCIATDSFAIVSYNSYEYCLKLMYNTDTQRLCSLVAELLPD